MMQVTGEVERIPACAEDAPLHAVEIGYGNHHAAAGSQQAVRHSEVLTRIAFDAAPNSAYVKFHHPASHYAVVGVAVVLKMEGGTIGSARVAITGIGDAAFRAGAVESALKGVNPSDAAAVSAACAGAARGVKARSDTFASATYRSAMADVYAARAVAKAASKR